MATQCKKSQKTALYVAFWGIVYCAVFVFLTILQLYFKKIKKNIKKHLQNWQKWFTI